MVADDGPPPTPRRGICSGAGPCTYCFRRELRGCFVRFAEVGGPRAHSYRLENGTEKMTKIVAVSDTHGRHRRVEIPDGDVLVHAGDFTGSGSLRDVEEFDDWLSQFPHPTKILVAGNCDGICEMSPDQVREALTEARYLEDEALEVDGLNFWGSPWQPVFLDMSFNLPRGEELAEKWALVPDDTDVLVTHGPPAGILDRTSRGEEVGDEELLARVTEVRPKLHVFGHIHESMGVEERRGTTFCNAACNKSSNNPFVFEIEA